MKMGYELKHNTSKKISAGKYFPLGSKIVKKDSKTIDVNFAIYSQNASEVFLLLFDTPDGDPSDIIRLENKTKYIWYTMVHGLKPGQIYGYKVRGEYNPAYGMRFNENKLLADPYAKAFTGKYINTDNLLLAYDPNSQNMDLSFDGRDNTCSVPKCIVIDDEFDWDGDEHPDIPFEKSIIYEVHIKGFTAHPSSKVKKPGTYEGFIEKIPHLKELGINAVEFLPLQEFYVEDFLIKRGLTNYWGYNTIGFFTPESSYASAPGKQVEEFKKMVRALHKEGIEVILDVVYNHTGEGSELGPTIGFRGIDNPTYYCLTSNYGYPYRYYQNFTGCGNSLNISNPNVIRLVMDSLRYWVQEMHVDGFRFDLASVLGRDQGHFEKSGSFFDAITQDPLLNRIKLIAEPWDIGTYQVGNFPIDWSEWNGRFRDTFRKFSKGDGGQLHEVGWRLTGSADLYGDDGRSAYNSINFITCHDGFTLNDLVSYDYKHNDANLEDNKDGTDDNNSWNCGTEGETNDGNIVYLRKQMAKNHILSLIFSSGTPMILGGDEFLRTQKGNNNAYCQDNDISWFDWNLAQKNSDIFNFIKKAIAFTKKYTILQRRKFFQGRDLNGNDIPDIQWFGPSLNPPAWNNPETRTICYQLDGTEEVCDQGEYYLFIILNADFHLEKIMLPTLPNGKKWHRVADTSLEVGDDFLEAGMEILINPPEFYLSDPKSTVVLLGK
jgi:isoamylase